MLVVTRHFAPPQFVVTQRPKRAIGSRRPMPSASRLLGAPGRSMAVRLSLRLRALQTRADAGGGAVADSVASSATSAVASSYERSKRYVVWLVKQLDSHLCDLDRRIEKHIANRAQAAREGAYEQIAHEQNKLGELCVEHKARLDSMLFFWILGGGLSFAGWVSGLQASGCGRSGRTWG